MVKKWLLAFAAAAFAAVTLFAVGCAPEETFTPGDEVGEYYYEAEGGEYLLTLEEDGSASLSVGEDLSGTYTLAGDALTLNLGEQTIDAEYSETSISLTYGGEEMEFLKKVYFTVTFETNGGTAIESAQVLNGKTVAEPEEEPSRKRSRAAPTIRFPAGTATARRAFPSILKRRSRQTRRCTRAGSM